MKIDEAGDSLPQKSNPDVVNRFNIQQNRENLNSSDDEIIPETDDNESSGTESSVSLFGHEENTDVNELIAETSSESEIEARSVHMDNIIVSESDQSETGENLNEILSNDGDRVICETPDSSEAEETQHENDDPINVDHISETSTESEADESHHSHDEVIMESDLSKSDSSDIENAQRTNHPMQDVIENYPETDSSEDVAGENEIIISATPSESEENLTEMTTDINRIESQIVHNTSESSPHLQSQLEVVDNINENIDGDIMSLNPPSSPEETRVAEIISNNIQDDDYIPEINTQTSIESSERFDHHILELPQDEIEENFLEIFMEPIFAVPDLPQDAHIQSAVDRRLSDVDDDDQTIMTVQNNPIEISPRSREIIERIERFIAGAVRDLKNGLKVQIVVQNRQNWDNCFIESERYILLPISDARCRHIRSSFSQSVIFYLLAEIHENLMTNRRCTVRELYYKDVNATQRQENVSEALKTVCCLLDATPWELGVLSTSKGLIAGPLKIHLPENVIIDCSIDKNGITLPHLTSGIVHLETTAKHVLVVEKDTVFKNLLQSNILERWKQSCIIITGKGYPDMNTRIILKKLRELYSLAIDIVTDADPYGIEIMLTYRHGSLSMSNLAEELAVPSARWLGILPSDIRKFGIRSMELTEEDKRKLDNILNRPFINDHVHRELLIMKQINLKAEIEGISDSSCTYLIDVYLRNKIDNNNGI